MRLLAPILILLIASTAARADFPRETEEGCPTVDLSDRLSGPRDQGGAGFCYSFTAADLLSEAAGIKPPDSVSAFHAGSQYVSLNQSEVLAANKSTDFAYSIAKMAPRANRMGGMGQWQAGPGMGGMGGSPAEASDPQLYFHRKVDVKGKGLLRREGGYIETIAAHLVNQGRVCLESEISSQMMLRNSSDKEQQSFFMMKMGRTGGGDDLNKAVEEIERQHALENPISEDPLHPFCFQRASEPFRFIKPLEKLSGAIQDWAAARLRRDTDAQCKHPIALPSSIKVHSREYPNMVGIDLLQARGDMRDLMNKSRPVGLSYDSCQLTNCKVGEVGHHGSVVVGRGWNKELNRCELKIKNSWGTGCSNVKPGVSCDQGYWFVNEDDIYNAGHRITWIDK